MFGFFGVSRKSLFVCFFLLTAETDFDRLSVWLQRVVAEGFTALVFENRIAECVVIVRCTQQQNFGFFKLYQYKTGEFDPGSERTLAACLTHASRTGLYFVAIQDID